MSNAMKSIETVNNKDDINKYKMVPPRGVRNLSSADLENVKVYGKAPNKRTIHQFL